MAEARTFTPLEMLARLVSFDTESQRSNLPLIDFVEDYLAGWGVASTRLPNAAGDKHALFATLGPAERGGVLLSGHTDVVPVAGQAWHSDPYRLRCEDGRAYGRGSVDMKGFVALALALVPAMIEAGLARPIHLLLSYDEETTCLGSVPAIRRFGHDLPRPEIAIVGEPTGLAVVDAHKSVVTFETIVHGVAAHSAKPALGANAIAAGAEFACELNRIADELMERGDASGRFDPPFSTINIGGIQGGTARNITAERCTIHWEYRGLPDLDPDEVPDRMARFAESVRQARLSGHGDAGRIETRMEVLVPGLAPQPGSIAEQLGFALTGANATGTVPFGTEAGHFQAAGIPTIVCGPGTIDRAHQANEYITLDELAEGEAFLRRLIAGCA